ncbi:MAG TPA: ferredoxin [Methylophilaceae bacterium]|nr:ferredoxin [Methylophilaceae bacterium]
MSKYSITFANTDQVALVPRGTRVVEAAEKVGANMVFGCRENDCGDCMIDVLQGAENLSPPSTLEISLLKQKFAKPSNRLACQAMIWGDVTVKPA